MAKVLVIDDDRVIHSVAHKTLDGEYDVVDAFDGKQGIEIAVSELPEIILLDVEMPGMNGYEVCDVLKHNSLTRDIPVIFVSSLSDLRARMQGYEMGGADYIVKPYEPEDLLARMSVLIKYRADQDELKEKYLEAHRTAITALSGTGELGQVMLFVENSYDDSSFDELAESVFSVTGRLGLNVVVFMQAGGELCWFANNGAVSPLEKQLMNMVRNERRIYDFGCRTQINYPKISLLIKNMPLEDMEKYGRYKDLLPPMLSVADAKINSLEINDAIKAQASQLNTAMQNIEETIAQLTTMLQDSQTKSTKVMRDMLKDLTMELPGMGLEDDQEERILNRIEEATVESGDVINASEEVKEIFNSVISELKQLVIRQNMMLDAIVNRKRRQASEDDGDLMDVELF